MAAKKEVIGEVAQAQINNWKQAHGDVYRFEVQLDDSTHVCYLREPEIDKLGAIATKAKTDELGSSLMFIKTCWLGGDEAFKSRVKLLVGIAANLSVLTENKLASVKKL